MSMDVQKTPRRGRLYCCLHCASGRISYVAERYRVVEHVQKHHLALDQAAFYCNLCMFRCATREQLERHVTSYRRHVMMAAALGARTDVKKHLIANPNPRKILEGIDYRLATLEDQVGQPFVRPEDPFEETYTPTPAPAPMPALTPISASMPTPAQTPIPSVQDLVTVQVTPEVLASLLSPKVSTSAPSILAAPMSTAPLTDSSLLDSGYDPTRPTYSGMPLHSSPLDNNFVATTASFLSLGQSLPQLPTVSSCAPVSVPVSTTPSTAVRRPTPLNTPDLNVRGSHPESPKYPADDEENVLHQILGRNSPMVFSPASSRKGATTATKTTSTREQGTQTKTTVEQMSERYQPITATLHHFEKTMEVSLSKMTEAIESSARATRVLGKTIEDMADSMRALSRSVERMSEEQRRQGRREESATRSEKRPRLEDKENVPSLKSVVEKKSNSSSRK